MSGTRQHFSHPNMARLAASGQPIRLKTTKVQRKMETMHLFIRLRLCMYMKYFTMSLNEKRKGKGNYYASESKKA